MRVLSVPGCGLPLALIHHDAQLPLTRFLSGERYRLGDKPPNRRVMALAITWRIPQPDREADYYAHALYDDGELVEMRHGRIRDMEVDTDHPGDPAPERDEV